MMLLLAMAMAPGEMHPKVIECAAAVRAQSEETKAPCARPPVELWGEKGEAPKYILTQECASALAAGANVNRVPTSVRWSMRREFEKAMQACEKSVFDPPPPVPVRKTTKLWD